MRSRADYAIGKLQFALDPEMLVSEMPVGHKQFTEIAREIVRENIKLLVLDEPTAVLGETEAVILLDSVKRLAAEGISVIFISTQVVRSPGYGSQGDSSPGRGRGKGGGIKKDLHTPGCGMDGRPGDLPGKQGRKKDILGSPICLKGFQPLGGYAGRDCSGRLPFRKGGGDLRDRRSCGTGETGNS